MSAVITDFFTQQTGTDTELNFFQWSPLRQEPEAPFNNATSRVLWREPPAEVGGLQVAGFKMPLY